jgi:hypothetical protein
MDRVILRFERLQEASSQMTNTPPVLHPLIVLRSPDMQIAKGTWQDYKPALPLTMAGGIYGGAGALFAILFARLGIGVTRLLNRRRKRKAGSTIQFGNEAGRLAGGLRKTSGERVLTETDRKHIISGTRPIPEVEPEIRSQIRR